jgi:hypothetical protein
MEYSGMGHEKKWNEAKMGCLFNEKKNMAI